MEIVLHSTQIRLKIIIHSIGKNIRYEKILLDIISASTWLLEWTDQIILVDGMAQMQVGKLYYTAEFGPQ
mgnify:CR=1 FL=1